ncbi:hypothetical protein TNCV_3303221 [Trichonephila clavipes]|nr:hypothetical protein TNCV_3303221 [Trichonephila clavipes]
MALEFTTSRRVHAKKNYGCIEDKRRPNEMVSECYINITLKVKRGLLVTDLVILTHGQVTEMTPKLDQTTYKVKNKQTKECDKAVLVDHHRCPHVSVARAVWEQWSHLISSRKPEDVPMYHWCVGGMRYIEFGSFI